MPEVLEKFDLERIESENNGDPSLQNPGNASGHLDSFHFKLPIFEGPLALLLHLIKDQKIEIYDIPIVEITHQYMEYLELMKELNLEIAGEFLVMAATLIHIKSRMLLPPDEEEKEETLEDPRAELIERLLEYQTFKDSAGQLRKREDIWKNIFRKNVPDKKHFEFEPEPVLFDANVYDLISAFKKLLEKAPEKVVEITRESLTVADRINFIIERLGGENGTRFKDLFEEGFTRLDLIVTFIALLEVVRLGLVKIYQEKAFGPIWIINPQQKVFMETAEVAGVGVAESSEVLA
jgi:segregation and condensation protein A